MIHYDLRCTRGHGFDGWFPGSAGFEDQARRGLLTCPVCGTSAVERALMAPAIGNRRTAPQREQGEPDRKEPDGPAAPPSATGAGDPGPAVPMPAPPVAAPPLPTPERMRAMLRMMRVEVERRCEYVGPALATEARRIHDGEAPARGIYGEATPREAEALRDDGIEVMNLPWVPLTDD